MKKLLERITRRRAENQTKDAAPQETPEDGLPTEPEPGGTMEAAPKPLPELPLFFMLSHLDDDGPVRLDGVKLGVCEVMGLELDEPKLGAFAGALNALDFPAQLLIRQHPPRLDSLRENLQRAQPEDLPPQTRAASESLGRLLTELESRDGILDRRFYAVCEFERIDDLRGLLARAGLSVHPLRGRQLRMFFVAAALGGSPAEMDEDASVEVEMGRREMRIGGTLVRSLHLGKWPRSLAPGFLQGLMAAGAPMDLSVHVGPIPTEQAARTLEWQKVRFESAQSLSFKRGPHHVPGGGDRPGGRDPAPRRGAAGAGAALSCLSIHHPARQGRGCAQGDDPEGEGPLRRHPGQARRPGLPPARGAAFDIAPGPERRGRVADAGHLQHRPALPLLSPGPGHPQRHPLRHRHAGLLARRVRPLGRDSPQRQYRSAGPLRLWKILCHQAGNAAGPDEGSDRLRHRPGGRVRGHGPRCRRQGPLPRRARRGDEPLCDRQGRLRGASPAHRQPAPSHRGDGGRESRRGAPRSPRSRPGGLLRPAPRAHRLPRLLQVPASRRGGRPRSRPAAAAVRHRQPASTSSPTRATTYSPVARP